MVKRTGIRVLYMMMAWMLLVITAAAQGPSKIALARQLALEKNYVQAIPMYKEVYDQAPFDKTVYNEYLEVLLNAGEYGDAEKLADYMSQIRREDATIFIDKGVVYEKWGKKKQAEESYMKAVNIAGNDDYNTRMIAEAFKRAGKKDYAIKVYERARTETQNPYIYSAELSLLYSESGNSSDALNSMMNAAVIQPQTIESIKASLLKMVSEDAGKMDDIQKELNIRIRKEPDNPVWNDLQSWLYTQSGNYSKALEQAIALDKKLKEPGDRVYAFATIAGKDGQSDLALKAYDYVLAKGSQNYLYETALLEKINLQTRMIQDRVPVDQALLQHDLENYQTLFQQFPQYLTLEPRRSYALLLARYAGRVDSAIAVLAELIKTPGLAKEFIGNCKLDLGDYLVLDQKLWEASLTYSQVDKDFKQDILGEEARYRNARLAYYRGDFEWAQKQLSVLKASTTELIANDALYLSVLITENIPADSNIAPLLRFAAADLLLFQNKTKEADALLDSVAVAFADNPLQDDILLLRSRIALQERRDPDAIRFLEDILKKYNDDVLGDDAAYRLAQIYEDRQKDKSKALEYYEKVILDYPGSTYAQQARVKFNELKAGKSS